MTVFVSWFTVLMACIITRRAALGFAVRRALAARNPVFPSRSIFLRVKHLHTTSSSSSSSYEVDSDEDSEQLLIDHPLDADSATINGLRIGSRYYNALEAVGIFPGDLKQVSNLPPKRTLSPNDVFCNRELRLSGIQAIGFDMDYTLAQYQQPAFDKLAFDGAKEKLVHKLGYPKEVLDFEYDHTYWTRGLIIDIQRGNFLKIDRHKYARVAYHGFDTISSTTRKHLYSRAFNKVVSFSEKHFVNMDTLFQFVDAHLFACLIELKDKGESDYLDFKTYEELYREVRECVDLCHRDGVIKDEVARNPEKYIVLDHGLLPMLEKYRNAGVKVFLLTNSYWEYTSEAMNYLYHGKHVDEEIKNRNEWLDMFDLA
jgi:HAD superfamily 5'-nucleotidase-like hydrolase